MRASDEDRQRAVDELRRHCAAGRIDVDEYAARVERALSASTLEELDVVRADLPMLRLPEPAGDGGVWATRRRAGRDGDSPHQEGMTLAAVVVAAITVAVVLSAVLVGLLAEWAWAVLLVAGWAVGMVQGRISRGYKRHR